MRTAISSACGSTLANLGAYVSTFGAAIPSAIYSALLAGVYRTPAIFVEVTGVFTNTTPTDAYRGAGRPEACYVLERLADRRRRASSASTAPRSAAATSSRERDALQDADRPDLRLRRFPEDLRAGAGACAITTGLPRAARAAAPRTPARHRHGLLCRIIGRGAVALRRRARRARRLL